MDSKIFTEHWVAWCSGGFPVLLAAIRHMPPPFASSPYLVRWAFDTLQDVGKNNDRIGERAPDPKVPPASAASENLLEKKEG